MSPSSNASKHFVHITNFISLYIIVLALTNFNCTTSSYYREGVEEVWDYSTIMGEQAYRRYKFDQVEIYEQLIWRDSSVVKMVIDSFTNELTPKLISSVKLPGRIYFVFQKDSTYGYRYDSWQMDRIERTSVKKFLLQLHGTNRYDSFLAIKPTQVVWNRNKTELKEVYEFPRQPGNPITGRLIMYYSKQMNSLSESINSKVDSIRGMKFFKQETIFDPFYDKNTGQNWPENKTITEIRLVRADSLQQIKQFVEKYRKEILRN